MPGGPRQPEVRAILSSDVGGNTQEVAEKVTKYLEHAGSELGRQRSQDSLLPRLQDINMKPESSVCGGVSGREGHRPKNRRRFDCLIA